MRFVLGAFFDGRRSAGRAAAVFFFELRARGAAFFLEPFLRAEAVPLDFLVVTFFLEPFFLADVLPALATFFLLDFFVVFLLAFFFLPTVFFLVAVFFVARFLGAFFARDPEDARATGLGDDRAPVFFETLFLAAAFFLGMRGISESS